MKGEQFIKLPRAVLESPAFDALSINGFRLIRFLMIEHMKKGGQHNGRLLAPRQQLERFGIGARHISPAINEVEQLGLVDVQRGVGRRPSAYTLSWLPLPDGKPASNRWRDSKKAEMTSDRKPLQMTSEGKHLGYPKGSHNGRSNFLSEVAKPRNKGIRREAPLKKSLTKAAAIIPLSRDRVKPGIRDADVP